MTRDEMVVARIREFRSLPAAKILLRRATGMKGAP